MAGLYFNSGIDKGFENDLKRMNKKMNSSTKDIQKNAHGIDTSFEKIGGTIRDMAAIGGFAMMAAQLKQLTDETYKYRNLITKLTGEQGESLNTFTANMTASAGTFGKDVDEMSLAVTNFAKGMGLEFEEALTLVDTGFIEGADGSKEFLDTLKEYSPLMAEAGIEGKQFIDIITQSVKQGIYSDKGIDTIKEAHLALREMTPAAAKALDDIGISSKELQEQLKNGSLSTFEALQKVSQKLATLPATSAKVGAVLADVFKGAGEDAGVGFIKILGDVGNEVDTVTEKLSATQSQEQELLKTNKELQKAIADLLPEKNPLTELTIAAKESIIFLIEHKEAIMGLAVAFGVWKASMAVSNQVQKLSIVQTRLQAITGTAASKATILMAGANKKLVGSLKSIRLAIAANPIGLLITGITLVLPLLSMFRDETDTITDSQNKNNEALDKRNKLAKEFQNIQGSQTAVGAMSTEQLKQHKAQLNERIKTEKNYYAELVAEANKAAENDKQLQNLRKKLANNTVEVLQIGLQRQIDLRKADVVSEQLAANDKRKIRITELEKSLQETEKILKSRPETVKELTAAEKKVKQKAYDDAQKALAKQLEIENQTRINNIHLQNENTIEGQQRLHNQLLENELEYLQEKRKITKDALEQSQIDAQIILTRQELSKQVTVPARKAFKDAGILPTSTTSTTTASTTGTDDGTNIKEITETASEAFSALGDSLAKELANLASTFTGAFETFSSESATTTQKAASLVGLISKAGEMIKSKVEASYRVEVEAVDKINKAVSDRIQAEQAVNQIIAERAELERNSSAFLAANYKDNYTAALQTITDSAKASEQAMAGLSSGLVLTAEGTGKSMLGLKKSTKEYSFTVDQILNGINEKSLRVGGTIANILDPADIFGGGSDSKAMIDSFQNVTKGYEAALSSLGKTSADMATFSSQEWADFYTVLDEGGFIVEEGTRELVSTLRESQEAYTSSLEQMKNIVGGVAGELGDSLGDAIVSSIEDGTDALMVFSDSLNGVLLQMAQAEMNELFFRGMFDNLQADMQSSMSEGGDQEWQDDLVSFYDELPGAVEGAQKFMRNFSEGLQDSGFAGIETKDEIPTADEVENIQEATVQTRAGQIQAAITEETGSELVGRFNAMMISNERIAGTSEDMLDLAITNLTLMNKIKENTDYLPEIADNTKKTVEKLENI